MKRRCIRRFFIRVEITVTAKLKYHFCQIIMGHFSKIESTLVVIRLSFSEKKVIAFRQLPKNKILFRIINYKSYFRF